jgi:hypothetical protein
MIDRRPLCLTFPIAAACLLFLIIQVADSSEWKGTREVIEGVVHVRNPAIPMEPPVEYELRELWRIESETEDGELIFGSIDGFLCDQDGVAYLLDQRLVTIHKISATGEYLGSISQYGEGPGDLLDPSGLVFVGPGNVGTSDSNSFAQFDQSGVPLDRWVPLLPEYEWFSLIHVYPDPDGFTASVRARKRNDTAYIFNAFIGRFSAKGDLQKTVNSREWTITRGEPFLWDEENGENYTVLALDANGCLFTAPSYSEYQIQRHNRSGDLDLVIGREFDRVKRVEEQIADIKAIKANEYSRIKRVSLSVSAFERSIAGLLPRNGGALWVESPLSWIGLPTGVAVKYDSFNSYGEYTNEVLVRGSIDQDNDYVFVFGEKVLIVRGGWSSYLSSKGVSSNESGLDESDDVPECALYEMYEL